ncbi:unnamed protein product, partial [Strongylus vulgaris]
MPCLLLSSTSQAVTPTPLNINGSATEGSSATLVQNNGKSERNRAFGKTFLTRPICVQSFTTKTLQNHLAVSDSCGGVYITDVEGNIKEHLPIDTLGYLLGVYITDVEGNIKEHVLVKNSSASSVAIDEKRVYITDVEGNIKEHVLVKNSSASSVAIDEKSDVMYVSIMQSKGRSVHVFDIANGFKKLDIIVCPKDPKIEMSRTRWLTVGPRGQLFMVSGDNAKSAL